MTPDKQARIDAVIARLHAEGQVITNDKVYTEIGGNRTSFTSYMRIWRAQQREAGAVAVLEACSPAATADRQDGPGPDKAPVVERSTRAQMPLLVALDQACIALRHAITEQQQLLERKTIEFQTAIGHGRTALATVRREKRLMRDRETLLPERTAAMERLTRAQAELTEYVGAKEAEKAVVDTTYTPRGL